MERAGDPGPTGLRCLQQSDQHRNHGQGLQPGRQIRLGDRRSRWRFRLASDRFLTFSPPRVGGQIDDGSSLKAARQGPFPEQSADVIMHAGADQSFEFLDGVPGRCLLDELADRLRQIAVLGEVDVLVGPQAVRIEAWHVLERHEGSVVIEAVVVADLGQCPLHCLGRAVELLGQRLPPGDAFLAELLHDSGGRGGPFHAVSFHVIVASIMTYLRLHVKTNQWPHNHLQSPCFSQLSPHCPVVASLARFCPPM